MTEVKLQRMQISFHFICEFGLMLPSKDEKRNYTLTHEKSL